MKPNRLLAIFFIACLAGFVACNQDDKKEDNHKMSSDDGDAKKIASNLFGFIYVCFK